MNYLKWGYIYSFACVIENEFNNLIYYYVKCASSSNNKFTIQYNTRLGQVNLVKVSLEWDRLFEVKLLEFRLSSVGSFNVSLKYFF